MDMREELNAAIEHVESGSDDPIEQSPVEETRAEEVSEGEGAEKVPGFDPPAEEETTEEAPSQDTLAQDEGVTGVDQATEKTDIKAPLDWSPQQREEWSKVPVSIQEQITKREQEMADHMANTGAARQTHDRMSRLAQNFAPILAAEGVSDPVQAAEGLFNTVSQLRMGSTQQKAQAVAGLISHYGIDIATLDDALVGTQTESPNADMERLLDQRMAPVNQLMQQLQQVEQQQTQQTRAKATQTIQEFSKDAEFLNDLRVPVADIIDAASRDGRNIDLKQAYDIACQLDPNVSQVLAQRKAQEALTGRTSDLQGKQLAASSLNGRRGGNPSTGGSTSLRDQLNSAWDDLSNG